MNTSVPFEDIRTIVRMKFGAHLYGTDTPDSDLDIKGVFLPSKRDILLATVPKCYNFTTGDQIGKNTSADTDIELYSLNYFIDLACQGQTVALDMLHAPDEMLLETSAIWHSIVSNRSAFYTRNLSSFINYARRQASKYGIKGSRLNAVQSVLDIMKKADGESRLRELWDDLPRNEHCIERGKDPNGMRQYEVCGKIFQESAKVGYVIPILEKFMESYGQRARLAASNTDIDWKAVSHALRAAYQVRELLTDNTITFPLKDAKFLMDVKTGSLDYLTVVAPALEALMEEVEELSSHSDLPEECDRAMWEDFICETIEREVFQK
jgi:hypothetical protein